MAGPSTVQNLSAQECQCPPTLTFYAILAITIFLSVANVGGGLAFWIYRRWVVNRRRAQGAWLENEKGPHFAAASLAPTRQSVYPGDGRGPLHSPGHTQFATEHVKVRVDVTAHSDALSPPPQRRSGVALLAKVLGKRPGGSSKASSGPRSPASSVRSRRSPLDPPSPSITEEPRDHVQIFEQQKYVDPKPRTVSLYIENKAHKTSPSGNHLLPPNGLAARTQPLSRGPSTRTVADSESMYSQSSAAHEVDAPAPVPRLETIQDSPPTSPTVPHRPPPLSLHKDKRISRQTVMSGLESPATPGTAPSAMFTGANGPRVLSYVWPHQEGRKKGPPSPLALNARDHRESVLPVPASAPTKSPDPIAASVRRTVSVESPNVLSNKAAKILDLSNKQAGVMNGPRRKTAHLPPLPASPTTPAPMPTTPLSPVTFAPASPLNIKKRRLTQTELPTPTRAAAAISDHRPKTDRSHPQPPDYDTAISPTLAPAQPSELREAQGRTAPSPIEPDRYHAPFILPTRRPSAPDTLPTMTSNISASPPSATWRRPPGHLSRPSAPLSGPRGMRVPNSAPAHGHHHQPHPRR